MSERVRRITKTTSNQPLGRKKKVIFLIVGILLILFIGSFLIYDQFFYKKNKAIFSFTNKEADSKSLSALLCRQELCFWLNEKGVAYHKSSRFSGNLVLLIEDKTSRTLVLGQELIKPAILTELNFLKKQILKETGLSLKIGETQDLKIDDFNFITDQGWSLRFSISENTYKTLAVLKQTLTQINPQDIPNLEYIDLRVPNKVYYKFK